MNLGFGEMFFIFLLALIIFGPKRLPEIGRQIGKALAEFKRYSNDFKYQLESEVRQWEVEETLRKEKEELKQSILPEGSIPTDVYSSHEAEPPATAEPPLAEPAAEAAAAEIPNSMNPANHSSKETNA
jgi:sec-independent protein translocase protein TatB